MRGKEAGDGDRPSRSLLLRLREGDSCIWRSQEPGRRVFTGKDFGAE